MTDTEKRELIKRLQCEHKNTGAFWYAKASTAIEETLWKPIDDMPDALKDGRRLMLHSTKWLEPCPGYLLTREYLLREYDDADLMESGWYPSTGFIFDLPEVVLKPTHYQELTAPEEQADERA